VQRELFVVGEVDGRVVGSVMAGYDGHRGWVNYLAVHPASRGMGHGQALMQHVEHQLLALGCPKLNLQVRAGNAEAMAFYRRIGYLPDDVLSLGRRLVPDGPPAATNGPAAPVADRPSSGLQATPASGAHGGSPAGDAPRDASLRGDDGAD
jgi:hypothetical protein